MQQLLFALPVTIAIGVVAMLALRGATPIESKLGWLSFLAHAASGLAMVAITEFVYEGGDMLAYARFGSMMAHKLSDDFFGVAPMIVGLLAHSEEPLPFPGALPGSSTGAMQGISAVLMFLLGDSLYAACLLIAGLSFLAKLAVFRVLRQELPKVPERWLLVACLLLPSAVFWSSGMLKEPIAVIGVGMMVHGGHRLTRGRSLRAALWWLSGAVVTGITKGYLLPAFGLAAAVWYFFSSSRVRARRNILLQTRYLVVGGLFALGLVALTGAVIPRFAPENFAEQAVRMQEIGAQTEAGSNYELASGGAGLSAAVALLAVLTALFRPLVFEASNAMMLLSALEMTVFTLLFAAAIVRKRVVGTIAAMLDNPALAFCAVFVLTLAVGVGLTTTNLGTLSRYRAPFMPFFGTLLFSLVLGRRVQREPPPALARGRTLA